MFGELGPAEFDETLVQPCDLGDEVAVLEPALAWSMFTASRQTPARCRNVDTALFFPARGDNLSVRVAKQLCSTCPVRGECLDYARDAGEKLGVWGGLTERQRRKLRARVNVVPP